MQSSTNRNSLPAFLAATVVGLMAVAFSALVEGVRQGDADFARGGPAVVLVFGLPFVALATLASFAVFIVARSRGYESRALAVGVGALTGLGGALIAQARLLPWYSGALAGAFSGYVWWVVYARSRGTEHTA